MVVKKKILPKTPRAKAHSQEVMSQTLFTRVSERTRTRTTRHAAKQGYTRGAFIRLCVERELERLDKLDARRQAAG